MVERKTGNEPEQTPQQIHDLALKAFNDQLSDQYEAGILRDKYKMLEETGRPVFEHPFDYLNELHNATNLALTKATSSGDDATAEFFSGLNSGIRIAMDMLTNPNTSSTPKDMTKAKS